jgi:hypothetical protein
MRYLVFALIFLNSGSGIEASAVQAALGTPPATSAKTDSNEPYVKRTCRDIPNNTVTGRVTSSTTIQMPKFACVSEDGGGSRFYNGGGFGFGYWVPCKNHDLGTPSLIWGRVCPNWPWLTMTVQLANPADAREMPLGKLVTLKGDFFVLTKNKVDYLFVQNARVLYDDPFGR